MTLGILRRDLHSLAGKYRTMVSRECPSRPATKVSLPQKLMCFRPNIAGT